MALVGPLAKVRDELPLWKETVLTTMILTADQRHLPALAECVLS